MFLDNSKHGFTGHLKFTCMLAVLLLFCFSFCQDRDNASAATKGMEVDNMSCNLMFALPWCEKPTISKNFLPADPCRCHLNIVVPCEQDCQMSVWWQWLWWLPAWYLSKWTLIPRVSPVKPMKQIRGKGHLKHTTSNLTSAPGLRVWALNPTLHKYIIIVFYSSFSSVLGRNLLSMNIPFRK
jgi:hypothetical protein